MELIEQLKRRYREGNLPMKLIYINVFIFLLSLLASFAQFDLLKWIEMKGFFASFIRSPWGIFSYMFAHADAMHLLFNMLMLYFVGDFFYRYFRERAFALFYFVGGICGGLIFLLFGTFIKVQAPLVGASAAIYSVLFAMVAYRPEMPMRILFIEKNFKLLHIAIGFLILGFLLNPNNLGGNLSHVGGALFGYFYMKEYEKGNDFLGKFVDSFLKLFRKRNKLRKVHKSRKAPRNDYDYNEWKAHKKEKIDHILDKISRSGYSSLSADEKEFLFKQGKG